MLTDSLNGIQVLDLSHVVAGPVCGMLLGDMGADVVKIEPIGGELGRRIGPPYVQGESVVALSVNRNKRGLAIDLKATEGQQVLQHMAARADVLIESFRPGVMQRLGLDAPALLQLQPKLVYCSISAFGQTGPWHARAGVDGIVQAVAGLMSAIGSEHSDPLKVSVPVADMTTGYLATIGILGALHKVRAGGAGQHLDVSLYNATLMLQQVGLAFFLATGEEPRKTGSAAPYAAPNEAFPTADGWIMVAAYQPERWSALCSVLDMPALRDDPRFADNSARVANRPALQELLGAALRRHDTAHWLARLDAADILCAPIAGYREVAASAQYRHSGIETCLQHPVAGSLRMPGFGLAGPAATAAPAAPPPLVGQHSVQVLAEYGIPGTTIQTLLARGVVAAGAAF
ncbi:CaiB/BaiF CoA-transferase family protein [Pseudorhodoferax sp. Leaf274]|uniref:CaiB/BaiF CoA transferase family protein n=1 Tax=Pseudorhodoferax sp. Leaf274 TaxID=1736318 RepID=UPI000702C3F8|nr:CoA transferase [Pseudorhodoferax sp. Leaf274]KQP49106.1 carnitine dehydratase [Pseudorhodoferax sp. Leaf274]